jgi:hypothetical protein
MLLVLFLLCGVFSALTWSEQRPEGAAAGRQVAAILRDSYGGAAQSSFSLSQPTSTGRSSLRCRMTWRTRPYRSTFSRGSRESSARDL